VRTQRSAHFREEKRISKQIKGDLTSHVANINNIDRSKGLLIVYPSPVARAKTPNLPPKEAGTPVLGSPYPTTEASCQVFPGGLEKTPHILGIYFLDILLFFCYFQLIPKQVFIIPDFIGGNDKLTGRTLPENALPSNQQLPEDTKRYKLLLVIFVFLSNPYLKHGAIDFGGPGRQHDGDNH
jgi:hypothetical protein